MITKNYKMKIQHLLLTLVAAVTLAVTGCNKDGTVNVDTAKLSQPRLPRAA